MDLEPNEPERGHFDRRDVLHRLLESHKPPEPHNITLDEYLSWDDERRAKFDDARLEHIVSSIVVPTPQLELLLEEVNMAAWFSRRHVGRTGVFLTGPATMGKTTAAYHAMVEALKRHEKRYPEWRELGHTPIVYVEISQGSTAKSLMGRFLDFLGVPYLPRTTLEERALMVRAHLQKGYTSLVVLDETQNLAKLTNGNFESAQAIKNLMNGIQAVQLIVGINIDETMLANGELGQQFAARSSLVKLAPLGYSTPQQRRLWAGVIHSFEEQLGLLNHAPTTLFPDAEYLWTLTSGSISALARVLTSSAVRLILRGDPEGETITREVLGGVRLDLTSERALDSGESEDRVGTRHAA